MEEQIQKVQEQPVKSPAIDRSLLDVVVDRIWRFFCSSRSAIGQIAFVAILVLIGTLRNSAAPQWLADLLPFTEGLVRRWYGWDVFHSFIFMMALAVLSVGIFIGGMLNRAPGMWKTIRNPTVRTTHGFLNSAKPSAYVSAPASREEFLAQLSAALRSKRYRIRTEQVGQETHIYADKNAYGILGTYPFHAALIIILLGGIVGAQWGFRDQEFAIPEGSVRDVGHGTDLSVGLTQFTDAYTQEGSPRDYRSDLVIYKNGEEVKSGEISVNHPMTYNNATFYQSSFGQAVQVRVHDANGNLIFDDSLPMIYKSTLNPDAAAARIDLLPLNATLVVIAPDENPRNLPQLDTIGVKSGEMFIQLRPASLAAGQMPPSAIVPQGQSVNLNGATIEFVREKRFTLLQVGYNPGMPLFILGGIMAVAGLAVVFYFPHRRIRAIVSQSSTGATAHMAPLAKRDWSGQRDFETLMADLRTKHGFFVEERSGNNADRPQSRVEAAEPTSVGTA